MSEEPVEYGFHYPLLSSEFPSQLVIDITERCNLACVHCQHSEFEKSPGFQGTDLPLELHKIVIDDIAENSHGTCRYLRYTGHGETLLHPKLPEMIRYVRDMGLIPTIPVNVTTNGMLLDEYKAAELLDSEVSVFDISIDAHSQESYSKIRVGGDYRTVRRNVMSLLNIINRRMLPAKVVVSFIEQPANAHEASEFKDFWTDLGCHYVVMRKLHSCAGAMPETAGKMREVAPPRRPCLYPWERMVVSPRGYYGFCPADWQYGAQICRVGEKTISEIWKGEFMAKLREAHLKNDYSCHGYCGQCPDWVFTFWPSEHRSYAVMMDKLGSK